MPLNYEEARAVVFDVLAGRADIPEPIEQWGHLLSAVRQVVDRRNRQPAPFNGRNLPFEDVETIREVFWDLFRQGYIMLGLNGDNPSWPWFKVTTGGRRLMTTGEPWRFHDATTYLQMVRGAMPDLADATAEYLSEAVSSFYADNLLAACVMLGVAAENEFLKLLDVAALHPAHADRFKAARSRKLIAQAIDNFRGALSTISSQLPRDALEGVETNFDAIQAVIRVARNQAGHPNAGRPTREQVYVYLQLFAPYAGQVYRLRAALTT